MHTLFEKLYLVGIIWLQNILEKKQQNKINLQEMLTWPIQDDGMNMTKNFEHDQKINTDEHLPSNLTKI